ncbi:MAG: isoprenylcysteine carboxylmethyltransferase family protein [Alphaproteobacteria bacterium]|nr:isoprenylcysteine carboxylmethyltransferase family protein [Alphaproteobacteria bacterium]
MTGTTPADNGAGRGDLPGVVARPPLIYGAGLALGFALEAVWPLSWPAAVSRQVAIALGLALIAAGGGIFVAAVVRMMRVGTNVPTWRPTTALVTDGVFARSRNPIYVAFAFIHGGIAFAAGNAWMLVLLVPALALIHWGVVLREERYLERKFGAAYLDYKSRVRRWL